jgi:hypothetical protein
MPTSEDLLFVGYDRPIAGRETTASELIEEGFAFLDKQKSDRKIEDYQAISLTPYGGDLSGFLLIHGSRHQLDALRASPEFDEFIVKAHMMMTGVRLITGLLGDIVKGRRLARIKTLASIEFK